MVDTLKQYLSKIKAPYGAEKVLKDECSFSFDNPESETGLYICMNKFLGLGKPYVELYRDVTGNAVFLHIKRIRKEIQKYDAPPKKKVAKLDIDVERGFNVDDKQFEEMYSVVVVPDFTDMLWSPPNPKQCAMGVWSVTLRARKKWIVIPLPNQDIPDEVQKSVEYILTAEAAIMTSAWGGVRKASKHAEHLLQLNNGINVPPKGWKCEKCDLRSNLWLNLTDGTILCGRKFFDGRVGNGHAVNHYEQTKYPLAVKLETITGERPDIYSYDEDDMVLNPYLEKHLAHFGINMSALEKTEETMIDLNQHYSEWNVIQESGSKLTPLYGPGYTGMRNLGNSCYMNSVMQVVFTIPDFIKKYAEKADEIFSTAPEDPSSDFNTQMAKLGKGLLFGAYPKPPPEDADEKGLPPNGIHPQMFKNLIGKGHAKFSTKRQQDAQEYFLHLIDLLEKNTRDNPADCFRFNVEERFECLQSKKVKYSNRDNFILALPVPLEAATNKDEVSAYKVRKSEAESQGKKLDPKDLVRHRIPFLSCMEYFAANETIKDFCSSAIKGKSVASKRTRFLSFPDYLMVQLKKFTIGDDWVPRKLDVSVDIPDDLDITLLRGSGLQPGEEELPSEQQATQDFSSPFQLPGSQPSKQGLFVASEKSLDEIIMHSGFSREQATKTLKATNGDIERAIEWLHKYRDGSGKYKLVAFISHMGTSSGVGHYVCHIIKDERWVIFNDEKVAVSEHPPKDLAYLYLYKRV